MPGHNHDRTESKGHPLTHVITQNCCNDATCVPVCPVNCIHPTPDEPDYRTAEMLYIDPDGCIDCGACLDACPVSAIHADYDLPEEFARYEEINAHYFTDPEKKEYDEVVPRKPKRSFDGAPDETLRVAIVGGGPAATYAAGELLGQRGISVEVDMFERLLTPGGLVRYGVAPDHQATKAMGDAFNAIMARKGFRLFAGVTVGTDVTHAQLAERYHAVLYAVGALHDRRLGIPGEDLPGSRSATEFVGWYNAHPDFADRDFDLSDVTDGRVVVLGNGNVALDVARLLASDPERVAGTDTADHAIDVLRDSNVTEVVVVGRRGAGQAAFTTPELLGLAGTDGIEVVVDADELAASRGVGAPEATSMAAYKIDVLEQVGDIAGENGGGRTVTLRFLSAPVEILGDETTGVTGVRLARTELVEEDGRIVARATDETEDLATSLVLRSVGYRGDAVPDVPFDADRGVLPNDGGRVTDPATGEAFAQTYVAGWIKRGPSGVIGTNKLCAEETVAGLLDDFTAGTLPAPATPDDLDTLLPDAVDVKGWRAIDTHEKKSGKDAKRPRIKITDISAARAVVEAAKA